MSEIPYNPNIQFPRPGDSTICYLKSVVSNPNIVVGDYSFYHDFEDPTQFERKNVLYHYPTCNHDRLVIGKFCSNAPFTHRRFCETKTWI